VSGSSDLIALFLFNKAGGFQTYDELKKLEPAISDRDDPRFILAVADGIDVMRKNKVMARVGKVAIGDRDITERMEGYADRLRDVYKQSQPFHAEAERLYYQLARHQHNVFGFEFAEAFRRVFRGVIDSFLESAPLRQFDVLIPESVRTSDDQEPPSERQRTSEALLEVWANGEDKGAFMLMWGYFWERLMKEHNALTESVPGSAISSVDPVGWIDPEVHKAARVREHEVKMATIRQDYLPDPEYGYFFTCVYEFGMKTLNNYRDEDFVDAAYQLLLKEGAATKEKSHFFSGEGRRAVELCREYLQGKLPWGEVIKGMGLASSMNHYVLIRAISRNGDMIENDYRCLQESALTSYLNGSHHDSRAVAAALQEANCPQRPSLDDWRRAWDTNFQKFNSIHRDSMQDLKRTVVRV
jgi:hypothetical protein